MVMGLVSHPLLFLVTEKTTMTCSLRSGLTMIYGNQVIQSSYETLKPVSSDNTDQIIDV